MPAQFGLWRINGSVEPVKFTTIATETKLEDVLSTHLGVIDPGLLLIGRQVATDYGKVVDILAVDADGVLTVVELKREKTPREIVAQVLDYASWVQGLSYERIAQIFAEQHPGAALEEAFASRFGASPPETMNEEHRLLIVATDLDPATERIIGYLAENYGVPINAVFFRYFQDGSNEYLARTWLISPEEAEAQASKAVAAKGGREPWNGKDFYASFGAGGPDRQWEDARRYGFVSAGGGKWYSATLSMLTPGSRVFACIPKAGYVGVGVVKAPPVPAKEFVVEVDGMATPLLAAPLAATSMGHDADDPEHCEYVVAVDWIKTLPEHTPIWEKGMFANQNSACRLRNKFTLERLRDRFGLTD